MRDPAKPRFARVPRGITCSFCIMLAGRGFVYANDKAAGGLDQYHGHCDCQIVPSWIPGQPMESPITGYDPQGHQDMWDASGHDLTILAQMTGENTTIPDPKPIHEWDPPLYPYTPTAVNRQVILYGDPDRLDKGGHSSGVGRKNKTEFPPSWTDDKIMQAIQATIDAPQKARLSGIVLRRWREVDNVIIQVATISAGTKQRLIHAYPVNGFGVILNVNDATGNIVARKKPLDRRGLL
ncbi:MAG: EndoU domain-containing protein [Propionibacteriaceae bacterium]|nr:EndoU domain-containing protein [Propionibacteriaceae bacterium]